ncbi:MAG TPA: cupin domain-containing protein [Thermoleophilaceae bacterium]|nr:cupin domain-containing protein [Thermoleophilaceae bacterium]
MESPPLDPPEGAAPEAYIGERLRAERERQGLSLRKLAGRLDISPSALSQIETGRSRPSVSTLYSIVSELGISFDDLFGRTPGGGVRRVRPAAGEEELVRRAGERPLIELESGVTWERLNPTGEPDVDFLEVVYDVGGASSPGGKFVHHAGREYGVVTSGTLKVTVGFREYELGAGDSICFDSAVPHRLESVGEEPARAIWFVIGRASSDARAQWTGDGGSPTS